MLEIFKSGTHTSASGAVISFSEADLAATVRAYDPARHEAPLVVGHPKDNAPAYGWVRSLDYAGGVLRAAPDQVDPAFAEMVSGGRFKKISASFYTPDSPHNPSPGVYYLRHVGFLGAQPPAVKGLRDASFSGTEEGVIEFGDYADRVNASLWRKLRDWFISSSSMDEADRIIPDYAIATLEEDARKTEIPSEIMPAVQYNEPSNQGDIMSAEDKARLAALEQENTALLAQSAQFAEREQRLQQQEAQARRMEIVAFADSLVGAGKLLPLHREGLVGFMVSLAAENIIEFGEGGAHQKIAAPDWFRMFLATLPRQVEFGEIARPESASAAVDFSAAPGYSVEAAGLEVHHKAQAYMRQHKVDYLAAVKAVS